MSPLVVPPTGSAVHPLRLPLKPPVSTSGIIPPPMPRFYIQSPRVLHLEAHGALMASASPVYLLRWAASDGYSAGTCLTTIMSAGSVETISNNRLTRGYRVRDRAPGRRGAAAPYRPGRPATAGPGPPRGTGECPRAADRARRH